MTSRSKSIIKYLVAALLLAVILRNTNLGKIGSYFAQIPPSHLLLALLFVTFAQVAAAFRMRYFFRTAGHHLNIKFAIILFYVGAFYNFLLPGGIGGDAYKVMLARKRLEMPTMEGVKLMVADRASGLCIVMLILYASLLRIDLSAIIPYANFLIAAAAIGTMSAYMLLSKLLLRQPPKGMLLSLPYSLYSQLLWVATIWVLWDSLGTGTNFIEYVILYCAASVAGLIPVSVGGLGIKESTYFYGAVLIKKYTGTPVDGELGITISLCVFALSFIASLPGIFWLHKVGNTDMSLLLHHPEEKAKN